MAWPGAGGRLLLDETVRTARQGIGGGELDEQSGKKNPSSHCMHVLDWSACLARRLSTLMLVGRCRPPSTRIVGARSSRAALLPDATFQVR
jgi:hypothetical protein